MVACKKNLEIHNRKLLLWRLSKSSIYRLLHLWDTALKEKGHGMVITAYGHSLVVWRRRVQLPRVNYLILRSTNAF